jgi:hypothetical protein
MATWQQKIVKQLGELRRQVSQTVRPGTVTHVEKDRIRLSMGKDAGGQDVLSPWLPIGGTLNAGATERRQYRVGQNVMMFAPGGDPSAALVMPHDVNEKNPPPNQADPVEQKKGESYQLGGLHVSKTKDTYDIFLNDDENEGGGGGQGGQQQGGQQGGQVSEPKVMFRLNKDGGFTARIGKDVRVSCNKKGAKLWTKGGDGQQHYFVVRADEPPYLRVSEPIEIGEDGIDNDDDRADTQGGGGQNGSGGE